MSQLQCGAAGLGALARKAPPRPRHHLDLSSQSVAFRLAIAAVLTSDYGRESIPFKRLLRASGSEPRRVVTDKLRSYCVAHRELIPDTIHDTSQYANNRAELSHQPTRVRERVMRRFKSTHQAQRFLNTHAAVYNLFNLGRHLLSARNYRYFRQRAFASWECATAN